MALFTSHAALRETSYQIRGLLRAEGIPLLAQGIDGTPRQLTDRLRAEPGSVLLGTASFWEGVDMDPGICGAFCSAGCPSRCPAIPSSRHGAICATTPFNDFQVPTAVLRFRQGFGRLIRNKMDRGAVVILDRRIQTANYGDRFLNALPTCTFERSSLATVGQQAARCCSWTVQLAINQSFDLAGSLESGQAHRWKSWATAGIPASWAATWYTSGNRMAGRVRGCQRIRGIRRRRPEHSVVLIFPPG